MSLVQQVYAQAAVLAGELTQQQSRILEALCTAGTTAMAARLRDGLTPADCKADFIAAASLMALAALDGLDDERNVEQITAGDLTMRRGSKGSAANYLRAQAALLMAPYLQTGFTFLGV